MVMKALKILEAEREKGTKKSGKKQQREHQGQRRRRHSMAE